MSKLNTRKRCPRGTRRDKKTGTCKKVKLSIMSKVEIFKSKYLNKDGKSELITRYNLPEGLAYTSGDSPIFRSDSIIGRSHKFARFNNSFPNNIERNISISWRQTITSEEKDMLLNEWSKMKFPKKGDDDYVKGKSSAVLYIKFYGLAEKKIINHGIRSDISKSIKKMPCCNCGTSRGIECDHKNDLWEYNDERIGHREKQTIDDFQPLCKHCNDVKRGVKAKTMKEQKRQPAPGFSVKFVEGTEHFDIKDPKWYKGTYWGDVMYFKRKLYIKK